MSAWALIAVGLWGTGLPLVAPPPQERVVGTQGLQHQVRHLMQQAREGKLPPEVLIPRMLKAYRRVGQAASVSPARRKELQGVLAHALVRQAEKMTYRVRAQRATGPRGGASRTAVPGTAGGPAEREQAQALIELIQRTICPDSWAVNGGNGTIFYFAPAKALVVRQRGQLHRRLEGLLKQLRK